MKKKRVKSRYKVVSRNNKNLAYKLLIVNIFILGFLIVGLIYIENFKKQKEGVSDLKGELESIGVWSDYDLSGTNIIKENCSDENLREIWDFVFQESSVDTEVVVDSPNNCSLYLIRKVNGNEVYFIFGEFAESGAYIQNLIFSVYSNFSDSFRDRLNDASSSFLVDLKEDVFGFFILGDINTDIQDIRSINNISEANIEYWSKFKIENGSWAYSDGWYSYDNGDFNIGAIFASKVFNGLIYSEVFGKPLNLTQIQTIPNIELYGGITNLNVINLEDYFENVGIEIVNLSFIFSVNESGIFEWGDVWLSNEGYIEINAPEIIKKEIFMNITLSHPEWLNGINVSSNNFKVSISGCKDSDGGMNASQNGNTTTPTMNKTDYCENKSMVIEYYCDYENVVIENITLSCNSGFVCLNGECVLNGSLNQTDPNANYAPRFLSDECYEFEWEVNTNLTIDLDNCFEDDDGDNLIYSYSNANNGNISILRQSGNQLKFIPDRGFIGRTYFYIYANDSIEEISRRSYLDVVAKKVNATSNTSTQTSTSLSTNPNIISSKPSYTKVSISPSENRPFSINGENYDSIKWYLDDELVAEDTSSYEFKKEGVGEYKLRAEIQKGAIIDSKIWEIIVEESSIIEDPILDIGDLVFYLIIVVIIIIILLIIWLFIIEKSRSSSARSGIGFGVSRVKIIESNRRGGGDLDFMNIPY